MGQIHGSGTGNWGNTAIVTDIGELLVTGSIYRADRDEEISIARENGTIWR